MKMKQRYSGFMRWTSRLMMVCMVSIFLPPSAFAVMVDTEMVAGYGSANQERAKILALADREEVRTQLLSYGVSLDQVRLRVNAMTDNEVLQVSQKMRELPAGGDFTWFLVGLYMLWVVLELTAIDD